MFILSVHQFYNYAAVGERLSLLRPVLQSLCRGEWVIKKFEQL